ncbi:hypothetical protein D3C83_120920 [compost metagenome]
MPCAMRGVRMHDLVAQHGSQFRFGIEFCEKTAVNHDLAAGQCPGVGHGAVDDAEFELQFLLPACP